MTQKAHGTLMGTRTLPAARRFTAAVALVCALASIAARPADTATRTPVGANKKVSRYASGAMPESARWHYADVYGVDQLSAKLAESGALVRFSFRVIDATKAQLLQDKTAVPSMLDQAANVALVIPTLEKVGPLRQSMPAENGKAYWMAFSNKGSPVQRGHRVSVIIGPVRIDGLIVQ